MHTMKKKNSQERDDAENSRAQFSKINVAVGNLAYEPQSRMSAPSLSGMAVLLLAIGGSLSAFAGLFDAVKSVAANVGVGSKCSWQLPSGMQCGKMPVDGCRYCAEHKCKYCGNSVWASGVCRECVKRDEESRSMALKRQRSATLVQAEKARFRVDTSQRKDQVSSRDEVLVKTTDGDNWLFGGFKLGMVAPYEFKKTEERRLDDLFLNVFESVILKYNEETKLLNEMEFVSMPLQTSDEQDVRTYIDSVCSKFESVYGVHFNRKTKFPEFRNQKIRCGIWCQSTRRIINGVPESLKTIRLTIVALASKQTPGVALQSKIEPLQHEIVPYGDRKYLHVPSGIVYTFTKYDDRINKEKYDAIQICGLRKDIVEKNPTLKIPAQIVHGADLAETGRYPICHLETFLAKIPLYWNRTIGRKKMIIDLSDFPASCFTMSVFKKDMLGEGFDKLRMPKDIVTSERFMKYVDGIANLDSRKKILEYFDAAEERNIYLDKMIREIDKSVKYPCDALCETHPALYKDLEAGVSRTWCKYWLEKNASYYREHDERDEPNLISSSGLGKNEIAATIGDNELVLVFDGREDVLVSLRCVFGNGGVDRTAIIEKYKKMFGSSTDVKISDGGVKVNRAMSRLPRTFKEQRELDRMAHSNDGMSVAVAQAVSELEPFGRVTLDMDARVYYQQIETLIVEGGGVSVRASSAAFKGCAFVSNKTYNRLAEGGRMCDLENLERCPYDAFFDEGGRCKIQNTSCEDALRTWSTSIKKDIEKIKMQDGRALEIEISGIDLAKAMAEKNREIQKLEIEQKKLQMREKDAKALDF